MPDCHYPPPNQDIIDLRRIFERSKRNNWQSEPCERLGNQRDADPLADEAGDGLVHLHFHHDPGAEARAAAIFMLVALNVGTRSAGVAMND
jgi:hypothetical protein